MDDLRGMAMTAYRSTRRTQSELGTASARYKNKKVAPRVLLINSEKTPAVSSYALKNSAGQLTEAMGSVFSPAY